MYRPQGVINGGILFWIHGGGYINGASADYDGIEQAKMGNIVVSVQYRLSLFGFMNLYDDKSGKTVGGNFGLKDQQLALQFISDNAQAFGGDRSKITINGESAGAMSVALHLHNLQSSQ